MQLLLAKKTKKNQNFKQIIMPDIVHVTYAQTGQSSKINALGMREMQEKAYQAWDAQYLLLKARRHRVSQGH